MPEFRRLEGDELIQKVLEEKPQTVRRLGVVTRSGEVRHTRVMAKRPTTARMERILRSLEITGVEFSAWCGLSKKDWIKNNPHWTERDWYELVVENMETIKNG